MRADMPALDTYLLGIDYGYTDATAFALLGWREHDSTVYVVECFARRGLTPSDAAEVAAELSERYKPVKIVGDTGGLGKGYAEEARRRFSLPIEPAEKQNKRGYQSLMNGDLERGRVVVSRNCTDLVKEWLELPWTEDHQREADGFDNHCSDATLYAWRAANAFHEQPKPALPTREQALREQEEQLWKSREEAISSPRNWWES